MQIYLGPAGLGGAKDAVENLQHFAKLGLEACEVAFTYSVYLKKPDAIRIGKEAKKLGIKLSIHAPYYINLSSDDKSKITASKKRILDSCERANYLWAEYVVFHPGYYGKQSKEETYEIIKQGILDLQKTIKEKKWKVALAPETTGKINVFGSVDEILKLAKETKCSFCIDFAHLYARQQGKVDYSQLLDKFKKFKYLHCHFSGINYTSKGERNHLNMDSHPPFEPLAKEILKRNLNVTIISESPNTWQDSLKQKKIFEGLGYKF